MLNTPLALELAHMLIRERLELAAREALANQLPAAGRLPASASAPAFAPLRLSAAARLSLASGLRSLAVRLDPSLACEASLVVPSSR
jgi:hypothetical protein